MRLGAARGAGIEAARTAVAGKGDALIAMTNGPKVSAYGPRSRLGWSRRREFDVVALGRNTAVGLGVEHERTTRQRQRALLAMTCAQETD